jgi:ferredoxin--NADP+ reductase
MDPIEKYNATVIAVVRWTPDLFTLKIRPDTQLAPFTAGQYVLLGLTSDRPRRLGAEPEFKESKPGRLVMRAYSIASGGQEPSTLEFFISQVNNGALTPRLVTLEAGERIYVGEKIRGHFTLDHVPEGNENIVLCATGTGLAPYISMLRDEDHFVHPHRFVLLQGAATGNELGYLDELSLRVSRHKNWSYAPSITRPHLYPWWQGETGRLTRYFEGTFLQDQFSVSLDPAKTSVFLCGNPAMISQVKEMLTPLGYTVGDAIHPGPLHIEEYW